MNAFPVLPGMVLLGMVAVYGSLNGGNTGFTVLFLVLSIASIYAARNAPRRNWYVLVTGLPLALTVGQDLIFVIAVTALVLGLALSAGDALRTRTDYLAFAGMLLFCFPAVLLFSLIPDTLSLAFILFAGAGTVAILLGLVSLRFKVGVRGDSR
jgi:hypothetical protein